MARAYRVVAHVGFNTGLALILVNLLLWPFFRAPRPAAHTEQPPLEPVVQMSIEQRLFRTKEPFYPDMTPEEVARLWVETTATYGRPLEFEPFTQFRERSFNGRYVRIDSNGFRHGAGQGPWPPDRTALNVFVFGGSTTFGYGLADDQTISSYLQPLLQASHPDRPVRVYNFGRGYYFSTQERVLFEQLLGAGFSPAVAIFIDGLNDFAHPDGVPANSPKLSICMTDKPRATPGFRAQLLGLWSSLPLGRAAGRARDRFVLGVRSPSPQLGAQALAPTRPPLRVDSKHTIRRVIRRVKRNKAMIDALGHAWGIRTVVVWQPVPMYKYDLAYHPEAKQGFGRHELSRSGYPAMARIVRKGRLGPDFVWCADIQEPLKEALYVDIVHYTPAMAARVAACIAEGIAAR